MQPKKAMEMQINFIVMLILAIVVFGLGSTIAIKIFNNMSDAPINKLPEISFDSNEKVVIPINKLAIPRGKNGVFGIGIKNKGETSYFTIDYSLSLAADKNNNEISCSDCNNWIVFSSKNYIIKLTKFGTKKDSIHVFVPKDAKSGTYTFNIQVKKCMDNKCQQKENYAAMKKISVIVP